MTVPVGNKNLVLVEYPGIVSNIDTALKTLNGIASIEEVDNSDKGKDNRPRRLELRLRPDDPFSKPIYGDKHDTKALVIRIRRQKQNVDGSNTSSAFETEVIGTVNRAFRFESLCDFQYLPVSQQANGGFQSIIGDVCASGLKHKDWVHKGCDTLFVLPPSFSRLGNISSSSYDFQDADVAKEAEKALMGDTLRKPRESFSYFLSFEDNNIPTGPHQTVIDKLKDKPAQFMTHLATVKTYFEQRPIWSRNALAYISGVSADDLKVLLPCVAFSYLNGPWHTLWVKFNYDPRHDPTAKQYQVLDFRIGHMVWGGQDAVRKKRNESRVRSQSHAISKGYSMTQSSADNSAVPDDVRHSEIFFKFRPGLLPPCRQMFYQLCDVEVDEVQELVHANDGEETVCTDVWGFCKPHVQDSCREILNKILADVVGLKKSVTVYSMAKQSKYKGKAVKYTIYLKQGDTDALADKEAGQSNAPQTAPDPDPNLNANTAQGDDDEEDDTSSSSDADMDPVPGDEVAEITEEELRQMEDDLLNELDL